MYFRLSDNVFFRRYEKYGYLCDNSLFGYRFLNDKKPILDEKFISESGAVMLEMLNRIPQELDFVVGKLLLIFEGVSKDELKEDVEAFFTELEREGYLVCGNTFEDCEKSEKTCTSKRSVKMASFLKTEDREKKFFGKNDLLRSIHIEIASECNERCVHCYIPHELKDTFIDADLFYKIVQEGRGMNIIHVTLSGGEPLLHKDILNFLKKCRELDLGVNVLTNLTLLNDDIVAEMKRNKFLCVQTSLYSMSSDIHDSITNVKGSFEKTKNNIIKLLNNGIPVQISCPVMRQNKDTFNDVISWGHSNNIPVVYDYVIFASYDRSNANLINRLSLKDVERVFVKQLSDEYVLGAKTKAKEKNALTSTDNVCSVCRFYFCVAANGDVFPCVGWQGNVVGNAKTTNLKEIWQNSKEINDLRSVTMKAFPKCLKCRNRGYCTICMMSNFNENGNAFKVSDFNCSVAAMMHAKIDNYALSKNKI